MTKPRRSNDRALSLAGLLVSAVLLTGVSATVSLAHDRGDGPSHGQSHSTSAGEHGKAHAGAQGNHHDGDKSNGQAHSGASASNGVSKPAAQGAAGGAAKPSDSAAAPATVAAAQTTSRSVARTAGGAPLAASTQSAPAGEVLAASTTTNPQVMQINTPRQVALASIPGIVGHAYMAAAGIGGPPDALKLALIAAWLLLNAGGFLVYRRRRARNVNGEFFPVSLGASTYRSGAGTRA